ncbi:MAG: putative DNA binding domain-containing protein [archaeon]|nr:putative DNA binding domain-containing protein [archaeon]
MEKAGCIEFTREFSESFLKTVVAFSNGEGGTIFIGIDDTGDIVGVDNADEAACRCVSLIADRIRPDVVLTTDVETIEKGGKTVLKIEVREGIRKPYFLREKGLCPEGVYVRETSFSVPLTDDGLHQMFQHLKAAAFESHISFIQDLSFTELRKVLESRGIPWDGPTRETFGIENRGRYTQLGHLLSDQYDQSIRMAVFEDDTRTSVRDRTILSGSIITQMYGAMDFLMKHNRISSKITGLERVDHYAFPVDALREALVNAVVHRDYASDASTLISIFPDRVEFTSPGGLNTPFTLPELESGVSSLRNRNLATLFHRLELVEAIGTGMPRLFRAYRNVDLKPRIEVSTSLFKVILPTTEKSSEESALGKLLESNEHITRSDLQEALGLTKFSAVQRINDLVAEGRIIKEGNGPSTRYRVLH